MSHFTFNDIKFTVKIVDLRNKAHQDKTEIQVFWSTQEQRDYLGDWGWWGRVLLPGDDPPPPRGHVWVLLGPPMQSSNLLHPSCNLTQPMRDKPNRAGFHGSNLGAPWSPMTSLCEFTISLGKQLSYKWSPIIFTYFSTLGLSCGRQNLLFIMWDHVLSSARTLVVAHGPQ